MVFAVIACGRHPRCALESQDAGEIRLSKIARLISECDASIHDISYVHLDPIVKLPRFNMPFELGMVIGAKLVRGGRSFSNRPVLVFESKKYTYQKYLSDIAGQDIKAHGNDATKVITIVRNWLRAADETARLPGEKMLQRYFAEFDKKLPEMCKLSHNDDEDLSYPDLLGFMQAFLEEKAASS